MERDFEKGGAVEYDPGRIPAFFVARGGWNRDDKGNGGPILVVEGGNTSPVVANPDRAAGGNSHAPWVDQISIEVCSDAGDVGLKISPAVGIGARRDNAK